MVVFVRLMFVEGRVVPVFWLLFLALFFYGCTSDSTAPTSSELVTSQPDAFEHIGLNVTVTEDGDNVSVKGVVGPSGFCGDGICQVRLGEDCSNCETDCGSCDIYEPPEEELPGNGEEPPEDCEMTEWGCCYEHCGSNPPYDCVYICE